MSSVSSPQMYGNARPVCTGGPSKLPLCTRHPVLVQFCAEWFCVPSESKALAESEKMNNQELLEYLGAYNS